mgnify:CR=1 FL=1
MNNKVADKIAFYREIAGYPGGHISWNMARNDYYAMLDGYETDIRETHYKGWTDNELKEVIKALDGSLASGY